jgi:hypothetical protein
MSKESENEQVVGKRLVGASARDVVNKTPWRTQAWHRADQTARRFGAWIEN